MGIMKVTDKKKYSKIVEKMVKIYEILYDLTPDQFAAKFYGEKFIQKYLNQNDYALIDRLMRISQLNLPVDVEAFQKYAECLRMSYEDSLWYLWSMCSKRVAVLISKMFVRPRRNEYNW